MIKLETNWGGLALDGKESISNPSCVRCSNKAFFLKSSKHAPTYPVAEIRFHPLLVRWNQKPHFWYEDWNLPRIAEFTADELTNEPNCETTFTGVENEAKWICYFSFKCLFIYLFILSIELWRQWVINYTDEYKFQFFFFPL